MIHLLQLINYEPDSFPISLFIAPFTSDKMLIH